MGNSFDGFDLGPTCEEHSEAAETAYFAHSLWVDGRKLTDAARRLSVYFAREHDAPVLVTEASEIINGWLDEQLECLLGEVGTSGARTPALNDLRSRTERHLATAERRRARVANIGLADEETAF